MFAVDVTVQQKKVKTHFKHLSLPLPIHVKSVFDKPNLGMAVKKSKVYLSALSASLKIPF